MIGAGTGIAPYRGICVQDSAIALSLILAGFLQEREHLRNTKKDQEHGENVLVFGIYFPPPSEDAVGE